MERLFQAYLEHLRVHGYSISSSHHARTVLPRLFDHLRNEGVEDVRAAREADLLSFLRRTSERRSARSGEPLTAWTVFAHLTCVRAFFAFLEKKGLILANPARELVLRKPERLPRALGEEEARRLMGAPPHWGATGQRDRAILEVLYGTGIRVGECTRLDLQDVDLSEGRLLVRNGKGRKDRVVPLVGQALMALARYLREVRLALVRDPKEPAVFLSAIGTRLSSLVVARQVRQYGKALGLRASPHVLRHSCATHLLRHGADVREIQQLLGHRALETTALYTKVDVTNLREVIARAHPRERPSRRRHTRGRRIRAPRDSDSCGTT
jgi:site-specific recombinase XerD